MDRRTAREFFQATGRRPESTATIADIIALVDHLDADSASGSEDGATTTTQTTGKKSARGNPLRRRR